MPAVHTLSPSSVEGHAEWEARGVYKLFNSRGGPVRYVGRSENVQRRLKEWERASDYRYFSVEHISNLEDAWKREVNLYHQNISSVDNEIHPRAPEGMTCHRCSRV